MTMTLISTPEKIRQRYTAAAEQRRQTAEKADGCVKWLKAQGFDVVRVEAGATGPRITIRPSPLCKRLDGVVPAYQRIGNIEQRYTFVFRFGCEVRWPEGGGA